MEYIVEFVGNILYTAYYLLVGQMLFGFKKANRKFEKTIMLVVLAIVSISWFHLGLLQRFVLHILSMLSLLIVYFNEKKRKLVLFYGIMLPVFAMLSLMFEIVVMECTSYLKINIEDNIKELIAMIMLFFYIAAVGHYFQKKYTKKLSDIEVPYLGLVVLLLFADAFIVIALGLFVEKELQTPKKGMFVLLYIGIVLGILFQLVLLLNSFLTRYIHIENENLAKQYLNNQKEHYHYLENREIKTKKFRHDIRSHLFILNNYLENEDFESAKNYLNTINEKVDEIGNVISVNNGIADAILNKFYDEAKEKGIELKVSGHFPMDCYVSAYDICTVLSNLLSNAILAESQCGGKMCLVEIRYSDENEIFMIVENDYNHELKIENGMLVTSKSESANHGLGLSIVKECVNKNNGVIVINTENNRFKVMLSMKNECKEM